MPFRYLRAMQRDPIALLGGIAREYGDAAHFRVGPQRIYLFNHPDLVRELLVTRHRSFHKSRVLQRAKIILGNGLLTSEENFHLRQRRLAQPAFHRQRIALYAQEMVRSTLRKRESWRDGDVVDIHHEMMRLTLAIVAKTLYDADVEGQADEIGAALTTLVDMFPLLMNPLSTFLQRLPLPRTRRLNAALGRLDATIYGIIEQRRASGEDRGDLLSTLLMAVDEEGDGSGMTNQQLRDEALTIFLAGHETTANALAWTFYLLARHPEAGEMLHEEIRDVLGDRPPTADDHPRLPVAESIVAESMRLYPPAWAVSRLAIEDVPIGSWLVPRGAVAVVSQALMHRDPRFWPEPARFDPARFSATARADRPKLAYFPFGAGPRVCIGEAFAWMEAVLLLVTIAQRWRVEAVSSDVVPKATITLRPRDGIRVKLRRRG